MQLRGRLPGRRSKPSKKGVIRDSSASEPSGGSRCAGPASNGPARAQDTQGSEQIHPQEPQAAGLISRVLSINFYNFFAYKKQYRPDKSGRYGETLQNWSQV